MSSRRERAHLFLKPELSNLLSLPIEKRAIKQLHGVLHHAHQCITKNKRRKVSSKKSTDRLSVETWTSDGGLVRRHRIAQELIRNEYAHLLDERNERE